MLSARTSLGHRVYGIDISENNILITGAFSGAPNGPEVGYYQAQTKAEKLKFPDWNDWGVDFECIWLSVCPCYRKMINMMWISININFGDNINGTKDIYIRGQ